MRLTPGRLAVAVGGAAAWVAGMLLIDGRTARIAFAAAFALALPAVLLLMDSGRQERRRTIGLGAFLLVALPLAVLVSDGDDDLEWLLPAGMAAGIVASALDRRGGPAEQAR